MINTRMKEYDYYLISDLNDEYGQPQTTPEAQGKIKISITTTSQSIQDNVNYKNAQYLGLTFDEVNDKYIIQYGEEKLKVLFVNSGRYNQVFLQVM